jgi:hypothetical protein
MFLIGERPRRNQTAPAKPPPARRFETKEPQAKGESFEPSDQDRGILLITRKGKQDLRCRLLVEVVKHFQYGSGNSGIAADHAAVVAPAADEGPR